MYKMNAIFRYVTDLLPSFTQPLLYPPKISYGLFHLSKKRHEPNHIFLYINIYFLCDCIYLYIHHVSLFVNIFLFLEDYFLYFNILLEFLPDYGMIN